MRASGRAYTIVRPGWFDYNEQDHLKLVVLPGDHRQSGTPRDGVVARRQIAEVRSLTSNAAWGKTFELVAERGQSRMISISGSLPWMLTKLAPWTLCMTARIYR